MLVRVPDDIPTMLKYATSLEAVKYLVAFMKAFEAKNG